MGYQMAATALTLNDLESHSQVAGLFKCNPSNICAAFHTISTDSVVARFLCISRASCLLSPSITITVVFRQKMTRFLGYQNRGFPARSIFIGKIPNGSRIYR